MEVMVEDKTARQLAVTLHKHEIPVSVMVPDVSILMGKPSPQRRPMVRKTKPTMDWQSYHRLDTIYKFLDSLACQFPHICSVHVIGKSAEGRDLKMLRISDNNPDNKAVWIDGTIHAREWITPATVTYIANYLAKNFFNCPMGVSSLDWYILPVMNPDGYEYTHTTDRMWRKNRQKYGECVGVDLNRNFSYGWGEKGEEGSSNDPGSSFHRGPEPFSEPETSAVRKFIINSQATFEIFLSFHSYGEVIIFPWGFKPDPCPTYVDLLDAGTTMSKTIYKTSGKIYRVGSTKDLMYYAAGTSVDWAYGILGIPYTFMLELRDKDNKFLLPKEEIVSTSREALNAVLSLVDYVERYKKPDSDSDTTNS